MKTTIEAVNAAENAYALASLAAIEIRLLREALTLTPNAMAENSLNALSIIISEIKCRGQQ